MVSCECSIVGALKAHQKWFMLITSYYLCWSREIWTPGRAIVSRSRHLCIVKALWDVFELPKGKLNLGRHFAITASRVGAEFQIYHFFPLLVVNSTMCLILQQHAIFSE